jgi:hypothetical protein
MTKYLLGSIRVLGVCRRPVPAGHVPSGNPHRCVPPAPRAGQAARLFAAVRPIVGPVRARKSDPRHEGPRVRALWRGRSRPWSRADGSPQESRRPRSPIRSSRAGRHGHRGRGPRGAPRQHAEKGGTSSGARLDRPAEAEEVEQRPGRPRPRSDGPAGSGGCACTARRSGDGEIGPASAARSARPTRGQYVRLADRPEVW